MRERDRDRDRYRYLSPFRSCHCVRSGDRNLAAEHRVGRGGGVEALAEQLGVAAGGGPKRRVGAQPLPGRRGDRYRYLSPFGGLF